MRVPPWGRSLIAGLLLSLAGADVARGQSVGYQLDRYEPTPAGDAFSIVEAPWYSSGPAYAAAIVFDYAYNLLVAESVDGSGNVVTAPSPIAHHQAAHLAVSGSIFDRVGLSLNMPVVLGQSGTLYAGVGPSGTAAGDPRVGVRARVLGEESSVISLSVAGYLWLPIGAEDDLAGDNGVRALARAIVSGRVTDSLRWAANASFLARERATLASTLPAGGNTVGSELQFSAGVAYAGLLERLAVGPEATLSFAVSGGLPSRQSVASLELYATARYGITDHVTLGLGVGGGVSGTGVPDARMLLTLGFAPARSRPLTSTFESVVVLPDEDGHIGGVEVNDGKRTTLLDKPYASTELRKGDKRARPVQSSPTAVAKSTTSLEKALPPSDRDQDGVVDASDGCPERAGLPSPDPIRHGCPVAAEKVVVLPDADGHVGGVEIDDGKTKTVLDTAYASAEVSTDGVATAVKPATPRSVERATASVAQSLPPPDADEDGILDHQDACPDRAGSASADPIRHGCPPAAERIVVLPDPDGHIGGVEVDDGKTKTLVDTAYGAVDVGSDGVARAVSPAAPRSVDRAITQLARSLPIADSDKDGIRDEDDVCPDRAGPGSLASLGPVAREPRSNPNPNPPNAGGPVSTDPLRHGCPVAVEKVVVFPDADGHVGGVEISDGTSKVLLDKPFASAEVSGGKLVAIAASPPGATTRAIANLARTLPAQDRDDDSIVDGSDACPTRPGKPSPQPKRHGCPTSVEQVTVLPDENGHVGAVEIDDGTTKTVLDQAYATAEVGTDGGTRTLTTEATEVSAKFGAAMAARPLGARIILYFTSRAEPVRDIAGPVDNLVAEVKARTDAYTLEIIGHTDQTGSEKTNLKIGRERAQLIADRLIAAGVPSDRVIVKSMGSKEPAVKLKSRRIVELLNRRVEIWVR